MKVSIQAVRELVGLIGAGLVGVGGWMHYPPLGLMLAGGLMFAISVAGTIRGRK